jgi:AraC family transcriptional regulator
MREPSIKQTEPMTVAFISMSGPYQQIPLAFGILYSWVSGRDLEAVGMPMGVYLSDPSTTAESDVIWELWAPVTGDAPESGPDERGLGVKKLPAMTVASVLHRGTYESIEPVYRALDGWIESQGYIVAGPPREVYMSDPESVPPEEYLTEVQVPVQRG